MSDRSTRTRYYDAASGRLVYLAQAADEAFWDAQWAARSEAIFSSPPAHRRTTRLTRKFLPPGAAVLEGGCGLGDRLHALEKAGYDASGIDFAPRVVGEIRRHWPHLKVLVGDVRRLPFPTATYDGYWSLGVIEHFFDGYDEIASEMHRVIRPGGYLFLTFPMMNEVRKRLARQGRYPSFDARNGAPSTFYQFALDPDDVIQRLSRFGFSVVYRRGVSSRLCLGEEFRAMRTASGWLDRLGIGTKVSVMADAVVGRYAGHSCWLVLRRNDGAGVSHR